LLLSQGRRGGLATSYPAQIIPRTSMDSGKMTKEQFTESFTVNNLLFMVILYLLDTPNYSCYVKPMLGYSEEASNQWNSTLSRLKYPPVLAIKLAISFAA